MVTLKPKAYRRGRRELSGPAGTPGPAALTLVSAAYDAGGAWVVLAFDRAVDVASMDVAAIRVDDGPSEQTVVGDAGRPPVLLGPNQVKVYLAFLTNYEKDGVLLTATAANGIVAADGGGAWAGVSGVGLPFP